MTGILAVLMWFAGCLAGWSQQIRFLPRSDFRPPAAMLDPTSIVAADLNGNGKTDIAVANPKLGCISVLLAEKGTLSLTANIPAGVRPERVHAGDFNGDGVPDLLSTGEEGFSLLTGSGNGSFALSLETRTSAGQEGYAVADFNRDGKTDIAAARLGTRILLSRGDGSFHESATLASAGTEVAAGDLNGDGSPDLLVTRAIQIFTAYIHYGDGQGGFRSVEAPYPPYRNCPPSSTSDLDGDGKDEVLTWCNLVLAASSGSLQSRSSPHEGFIAYVDSIAVADWNGDGVPNTAISWWYDWSYYPEAGIAVCFGQRDGNTSDVLHLSDAFPARLATGDFDGDGKPDLAVLRLDLSSIELYLGKGDGAFQVKRRAGSSANYVSIATGDFNGDGRPELVAGTPTGISVLSSEGEAFRERRFAGNSPEFIAPGWGASLAVADFNRDGRMDVAVGGDDGVDIRLGDGGGALGKPLITLTEGRIRFLAAVDADADGTPDLAVCLFSCSVLWGAGDGRFQASVLAIAPPVGVAGEPVSGDWNRDGRADLAFPAGSGVIAALNQGDRVFRITTSPGPPLTGLAPGDFNSDGIPDLAMYFFQSYGIHLTLGNGDGSFRGQARFGGDVCPGGIGSAVAADFNSDRKTDVAFLNGSCVVVLPGNGDGTFGTPLRLEVLGRPSALSAVDLNLDGKPDLAFADADGAVSVLINNSQ